MSRVFRVLAIGYGESKRMQVQALKQRFTLAEQDRRQCKVQGVDQSSLQILPHCRHAASDLDIFTACGLLREFERFFDSAGNKEEGRSSFHDYGLPLVVGQNKGWSMIRRIVVPPALP